MTVGLIGRWGVLLLFPALYQILAVYVVLVVALSGIAFDRALTSSLYSEVFGVTIGALLVPMLVAILLVGLFKIFRGGLPPASRARIDEYIRHTDHKYAYEMRRAMLPVRLQNSIKNWSDPKKTTEHFDDPYLWCRGGCHSSHLYGLAAKFSPWPWRVSDPFEPQLPLQKPKIATNAAPGGTAAGGRPHIETDLRKAEGAAEARAENIFKQSHMLSILSDVIVEKIAESLHVQLMQEPSKKLPYKWPFRTNWKAQKSYLHDGEDLPLRFRQVDPAGRFDDDEDAHRRKPRYIIICCLANPINDPIYVLPLASVLRKLESRYGKEQVDKSEIGKQESLADQAKKALLTQHAAMFDKIEIRPSNEKVFELESRGRRLLSEKDGQLVSGFDVHNLDFDKQKNWPRAPAARLHASIDLCINDASDGEVEIPLQAGDILIIDNYAALHRRRELQGRTWSVMARLPKRRCLEVYYGYPLADAPAQSASVAQGSAVPDMLPEFARNRPLEEIYADDPDDQ